VELVRDTEERCCRDGLLTLPCSPEDMRVFHEQFGVPASRMVLVPNGVDTESVPFVAPDDRRDARRRAGVDGTFVVAFMGSWHPPNLDAVDFLLRIAPELPDMRFLILGSVGLAHAGRAPPPNVRFLGVVDEDLRNTVLRLADVAVNPVVSGSGTNIKTLDCLAAGIPLLTTPFGARGILIGDGGQPLVVPRDGFHDALRAMRRDAALPGERALRQGRQLIEERYDWAVIAAGLAGRLSVEALG
jgi:glycosyltransferase involved in cell wall biosynthesis